MVKIYYMSDLHIDYNCMVIKDYKLLFKDIEPNNYLIIAGDLCEIRHKRELHEFFNYTSKIFKHIIYIAGNHEYYKNNLDDSIIREEIKEYDNITFLQDDFIDFEEDKFVVYGTTLWTGSSNDIALDMHVRDNMMDYKCIYQKNPDITRPPFGTYRIPITRQQIISLHLDMYYKLEEFLEDIAEDQHYKKIIVTHHLPSYNLISNEYINNACNSGYATDLDDKLKKLDFDYWICGHTHKSKDYELELNNGKKAKFYINPYGYDKENELFKPTKYIDMS